MSGEVSGLVLTLIATVKQRSAQMNIRSRVQALATPVLSLLLCGSLPEFNT